LGFVFLGQYFVSLASHTFPEYSNPSPTAEVPSSGRKKCVGDQDFTINWGLGEPWPWMIIITTTIIIIIIIILLLLVKV
jgi:hypothetical protein